ncbi:MAG TPA: bifunctional serine/threonine-protein kinase/formylglycine-generating enzyme family protein [Verrucomicrobiae bacterium]
MATEGFQPFDDYGSESSIRGLVAGQKVLKRYTLKRVLGRGGMGVVWLVHDDELDRDIAFKFLPDIVYHDKAAVESLKRETRRSLELTHPNIVRIYDFAQDEHCAGISMEYVAGDTLSNLRVCQPTHVFEVSDLEKWVKMLCLALEYAHREARVAHRDLKPANLMLNNKGVLKIADFGISRSISDNMTRVSSAVHGASGTLVYMSPQQALGEAASALDDIYSLGATLFELLTSKPPFFTGEIMTQVREKIPPTLAERRKQLGIMGKPIPPEWEETVAACLAKDPAKRPQSALEVLQRLGLADTSGLEAASLTTTVAAEVTNDVATPPEEKATTAKTEPVPLMQIDPPAPATGSKTTTRPAQPPMEFTIDSKGFKPVGPGDKPAIPQTTRPQRVARRSIAAMMAVLIFFVAALTYWVITAPTRLKSGTGGVEVTAMPDGAVLKLPNGKSLSAAGRIMDLAPGRYEAMVEKPDHEPLMVPLEVKEGQFTEFPKVNLKAFTGRVVLVSDPVGAKFSIDGKPAKAGEAIELRPGVHELTAEYAQWAPMKRQVTVLKDDELNEVFEFYPGTVEITSEPEGAKIFQGEKQIGVTPKVIAGVPPGGVLYTLVLDDHNSETVRGEVQGKQSLRLNRKLTKDQGTLALSSSLPGVNFYIDGRPLGQMGSSLKMETNVSPGRHEITAILRDWPKQERTVEISRGKVSPVQFDFAPASVVVSSDPRGATIIVRGLPVQTTPHTLDVKPGALNVLLQLEGHDPVLLETNVLSGETLVLHAVLPRMSRPFKIRTVPPDALLSMDGIWLTNRPPSFTVGKHLLRIEREGYEAREMEVEVKPSGLNDFGEFELERASGELRVLAQPTSATFELIVNGTRVEGKVAEALKGIPTGTHRVLVKAKGYEDKALDVVIRKNDITISDVVTLERSKGTMRIISTPEGAGYSLIGPDQVMRSGTTTRDEPNLPSGTYQVTYTMAGYETTNRAVEVHSGVAATAEVSLMRSLAPVRIQVNVAGAAFRLNGPNGFYDDGTLPLPQTPMPTGSYKLVVDKDGYDEVTQNFDVKKGETRLVDVKLVRSTGSLLATILPASANAELRGTGFSKAVVSGSKLENIPTGEYLLVATYKRWSVTNKVSIESKQISEVPVKLPFGSVQIDSTPSGALVFKDGRELGATPFPLDELELGRAKFQLRMARHRFEEVTVTVQPQQAVKVTKKLEVYAGPQPGMTMWTNSLGMRFVPVGNVWVSVWETRVKDFQAFYDSVRYNAGSGWRDPGFKQTSSEPVVEVSWNDATAFCKWLTDKESKGRVLEEASYRLPTQAEWLQVLKGGYAPGNHLWGNVWPVPSGVANLAENVSYDRHMFTAPAGSYFPAKNGVYDLIGNVWEWCQDGEGANKASMGQSWLQYPAGDFSPEMNRSSPVDARERDIGFRVVLVPAATN